MSIEIIVLLFVYFTAWYALATLMKNTGIIDIGWGAGFFVLALFQQVVYQHTIGWVFVVVVGFWGLRLAYHIGKRNLGKPEDFRYRNFREQWKDSFFVRAYVQLYLFQGLLMGIVALPYLEAMKTDSLLSPLLLLVGVLIFLVGYGFEVIGDAQLKAHTSNPKKKGTLIRTGLWQYTRHPNYFGDALLWWGIFVMALSGGAPLWTIVSPIVMTYLLRFVSGVPMLEKRMQKYPEFEEYAKETNIFLPWFKRESK